MKLLWEYSLSCSSSSHLHLHLHLNLLLLLLLLLLPLHLAILIYIINPLSCGRNTSSCTLSGFSLLVGDLSNEQILLLSTRILINLLHTTHSIHSAMASPVSKPFVESDSSDLESNSFSLHKFAVYETQAVSRLKPMLKCCLLHHILQ